MQQRKPVTILKTAESITTLCPKDPPGISKQQLDYYRNFYRNRLEKLKVEPMPDFDFVEFCVQYYLDQIKRGLMFYGTTGTGKTFRLKIIQGRFNLKYYTASELVRQFEADERLWYQAIRPLYPSFNDAKGFDVIIDDIGDEIQSMNYGKRAEVVRETIRERYDLFKQKGAKTFFSTNFDEQSIIDRYGDRSWSRLQEMCTLIKIDGKDRRTL